MTETTDSPTGGPNARPDRPDVIAHPPVLYAGALAAGAALDWLVPLPLLPAGTGWMVGVPGTVLALALAFWCFGLFTRAGTNVPTNRPSTALVTSGPYRVSRNPIYLALTLLGTALALWVNSAWMLGLLLPTLVILNIGVIDREERYLEARFGDAYRDYRARVRRWL